MQIIFEYSGDVEKGQEARRKALAAILGEYPAQAARIAKAANPAQTTSDRETKPATTQEAKR